MAMLCECGAKTQVVDSRSYDNGATIRRTRFCSDVKCNKDYHTVEEREGSSVRDQDARSTRAENRLMKARGRVMLAYLEEIE